MDPDFLGELLQVPDEEETHLPQFIHQKSITVTSALEHDGIIRTRFTLYLKKEKEKKNWKSDKIFEAKMFKILDVIQWYSLISERWEVHEVSPTIAPGYYLEFLGHGTERETLVGAGGCSVQ